MVLSPELIATADVALARVGNTNAGADSLSSSRPKASEFRHAKVSWWNSRTKFHYDNRKRFRKAFVKYWEAASRRVWNMVEVEDGGAGGTAGNSQSILAIIWGSM